MPLPFARHLACAAVVALGTPALAQDDHLAARDGLRVLHGWTPATEEDHAPLYLEIENTTDGEVSLIGASGAMAESITLVATPLDGTQGAMGIDALPISAQSAMDLAPGGVYLWAEGLGAPLREGDSVEVTLEFEPLGALTITVEVEAADAMQHSHAGHSH